MKSSNSRELAKKLMNFNMKLIRWHSSNMGKEYNKNGKSKYELTTRQHSILMAARASGKTTVSEINKFFGVSKSSLSLTFSKLVEEGYLEKEIPSAQEDGRKVYFVLTEKGMEVLKNTEERVIDMFEDFYKNLDKRKQKTLQEAIEKLNDIF